jgi:hypothetical protein
MIYNFVFVEKNIEVNVTWTLVYNFLTPKGSLDCLKLI